MFKREDKAGARIDSLLNNSTRIQGDILFSGGLHLDGNVTGSVRADGQSPSRLIISESAVVEGSVEAQTVELHGTVRGDIVGSQRVTLGAKACVEGNLQYGAIEMAAGARINGKLVKLG